MPGVVLDTGEDRQTDRQAITVHQDISDGEDFCGNHRRDSYQRQNPDT